MNKNLKEGLQLVREVTDRLSGLSEDKKAVFCPPYVHLTKVEELIRDQKNVFAGAQNCHEKESGAYTGEVSATMLASINITYVIIGHSERREHFNETNQQLAEKVDIALKHGLTPIFCCGEPLDIREEDGQYEYVFRQLEESLFHLDDEGFSKIAIAYEPIWAIGTGKTATPEQAQEMHAKIRGRIAEKYNAAIADGVTIQYGGSVKPDNAIDIFKGPDVDGGLIGGASLKSEDFLDIINSI